MKPYLRAAIVAAGVAGMMFLLGHKGDRVMAAGRPEVTLEHSERHAAPGRRHHTESDCARLCCRMAGAGGRA